MDLMSFRGQNQMEGKISFCGPVVMFPLPYPVAITNPFSRTNDVMAPRFTWWVFFKVSFLFQIKKHGGKNIVHRKKLGKASVLKKFFFKCIGLM